MPSHGLIHALGDLVSVETGWRWDGTHFARIANHWLANFDRHRDEIRDLLRLTHAKDVDWWLRRWRLFFLPTAGPIGHQDGNMWGASYYRLRPI